MKTLELIERINNGEDSFTQFKREAISAKDLAKEFVAFLNAAGGVIVFGVEDNGRIQGLSTAQIEELGQLIGNTANENVKPPFYPLVENRSINERKLVIAYVPKGSVKPYSTSGGEYLTKSGADKKKLSQEELRRLFAESKRLYADEESVYGTDITDLDTALFYKFLEKDNVAVFDAVKLGNLALAQVLENLDLLNNKQLTLAGNLIFGIRPQKFNKSFYIDCCYFDGNDVAVDRFISKRVVDGNLLTMFNNSLDFFKSNLKNLQTSENFNSYATLEIDERILILLILNALVLRDYYIQSSIKLFIFQNRVEIISPGKLTNSLTVEKIKSGISIHRNPILNSICKTILPYSGYGSGIRRALLINEDISFYNDTDKEQFICTIPREVSN